MSSAQEVSDLATVIGADVGGVDDRLTTLEGTVAGIGAVDANAFIQDNFALRRVDAFHQAAQADSASSQLTSIHSGAEIQEAWLDLSGWRALAGSAVASNRLATNSQVLKKFSIAPGEVGRIATVLRRPASGLGVNTYFGFDVGTDTPAPGTGDLG